MSKRTLIIEVITSIVALVVLIIAFISIKQNNESKVIGTICLEVYDINGDKKIDDDLDFEKNQTLIDLLKDNYSIVMGDGSYEGMVMEIEGYKSEPNNNIWLMIYVDGQYSLVGVNQIELKDGIVIAFKVEQY